MTFTLPEVAGATDYVVITRCGRDGVNAGSPVVVTVDVTCASADVYAAASMSGTIIGTFVHPNVALAAGGSVDLTADTYHPLHDVSITLSNIPANLFNLIGEAGIAVQTVDVEAQFYSATSPTLMKTLKYSDLENVNFVMTATMTDAASSADQEIVQFAP